MDKQFDLEAVTIVSKIDSEVWVDQHGQMFFLFLTYKVFKTKLYCASYNGEQGYDLCTVKETENQLLKDFGCVLPFSNSSFQICQNNTDSIQAFNQHDSKIGKFSP